MKERLVPSIDFCRFSWGILLLKVSLELVKKYSSLKKNMKGKSFILFIYFSFLFFYHFYIYLHVYTIVCALLPKKCYFRILKEDSQIPIYTIHSKKFCENSGKQLGFYEEIFEKEKACQAPVAHTCNPSYLGG
jgi:hypothetical protein